MDFKQIVEQLGLDWAKTEPIITRAQANGYTDEQIVEGIVGITLDWINTHGSVEHVIKMKLD